MIVERYLLAFGIGAILAMSVHLWFVSQKTLNSMKNLENRTTAYVNSLSNISNDIAKRTLDFEATGYTADVTDDGRIKVVFMKRIGPADPTKPDDGVSVIEHRVVILPAWMWAQVTADGAMKLGFEAIEKQKAKE